MASSSAIAAGALNKLMNVYRGKSYSNLSWFTSVVFIWQCKL